MTYQQAAQAALDVQDASNLSGVVHTFAEVVSALWQYQYCNTNNNVVGLNLHNVGGTRWINEHPIVTVFIDKLASLNGGDSVVAWEQVKAIAQGK